MKKTFYIGMISLLSFSIIGCSNKNIATVNGINITKEQYEKTMDIINHTNKYKDINYVDKIENKNNKDIKNNVLSFMIDNEVLYQKAKEEGFTPKSEDVELKYKEIENALNKNIKYKKLINELNLDKEYLMEEVKKDMTINNYKLDFENKIKIGNDDIQKYYFQNKNDFKIKEINASHILISNLDKDNKLVNKEENEALRKKANNILIRIHNGESFEELAKEYSDDKSSGKNGGQLGYFNKGDKNIEFTNEVFKLNKGEISNIIETSQGYHIVKVNDKIDKLKSIKESEGDINKEILKKLYIEHIENLNKESDIKIN
ncbi:peptidylprolyl isomerase [[Clostridium] dakarense]|uniref:peptidylprolyl isomerase n=1 Tax=Faecalimicrobium dakarense TaxID=1301100 RepID=UPI0004BC0AA3|nr:peptidylprolyl isomerase [[Clostridium] dakarense]